MRSHSKHLNRSDTVLFAFLKDHQVSSGKSSRAETSNNGFYSPHDYAYFPKATPICDFCGFICPVTQSLGNGLGLSQAILEGGKMELVFSITKL